MTEQPLSEFDLPEEDVDALQSVFDKPVIAAKPQSRVAAEYRGLAEDVRKLSLRQRMYLRFLMGSQMRVKPALRKMKETTGDAPTEGTTRLWHRNPMFQSVVDRSAQLMLAQAGIASPAQILLRIDGVVEDALTEQPIVAHKSGEVVGYEVNHTAALKGLELLGKAAGVFRKDEEQNQRVTVVLDFSGEQMQGEQESEIIDGQFTEVKK